MVKVASDRGASGVEPVFIVGSKFLVDSGLHQIAPFGNLEFARPEGRKRLDLRQATQRWSLKNHCGVHNGASFWAKNAYKLTFWGRRTEQRQSRSDQRPWHRRIWRESSSLSGNDPETRLTKPRSTCRSSAGRQEKAAEQRRRVAPAAFSATTIDTIDTIDMLPGNDFSILTSGQFKLKKFSFIETTIIQQETQSFVCS